jgi:hypothetical protein
MIIKRRFHPEVCRKAVFVQPNTNESNPMNKGLLPSHRVSGRRSVEHLTSKSGPTTVYTHPTEIDLFQKEFVEARACLVFFILGKVDCRQLI